MSAYEAQAQKFLKDFGISFKAARVNRKSPLWSKAGEPHGDHYRVTLKRWDGPSISFDFWGSIADAERGNPLTAYGVLACISGDYYTPETFEDFCSDYGYDQDSRTAEQTFKHADKFAKKLRDFFSEREAERLSEIS